MREVKNLEHTKKLIEIYRSITVDRIKMHIFNDDDGFIGHLIAARLTGFGSKETCILCPVVNGYCPKCINGRNNFSSAAPCVEHKTYENILRAKTPGKLRLAFSKRADYLEKSIKKYEESLTQL